ncbi:MAG TPA: hypothetical protein VF169_27175 [Albitalea sp.]|uniref:hypothetical protein n=1 Tax=Piscinibacter sp. TaxID=1903157 RepID=UPI002ED5BDDE
MGVQAAQALIALSLVAAATASPAEERPFVMAGTAIREEDDERVFELASGVERAGRAQAVVTQLEYSIVPSFSVEIGWGRRLGHDDDGQRETELQAGLRYVWRDPARHAIGAALTLEVEGSRETSSDEPGRWRMERSTVALPLSHAWTTWNGLAWAHLTVGAEHRRDQGTRPLIAAAGQVFVTRSLELFGEWGAVRERRSLAQAGLRWWIRRDKIALDFSAGQRRADGERVSTAMLSLSLMDLAY